MKRRAPALGIGFCVLASAMLAWTPVAQAQFFWSPFSQEQPAARPKPRPAKPKAPADDLPPIVPKESAAAPPPPDDRPYDAKLLRLAEILGAVHYLRELCGAQEGQLWRDEMKDIVKNEGSTAVRRAKLVNSFNDGYRGYRRTYRTCTSSATVAITRFSVEGSQIATALAKPSSYASRNSTGTATDATATTDAAAAPAGDAAATPDAKPEETSPAANQTEATPQTQASQGEAAAPEAGQVDSAEKPKRKKRKAATRTKPAQTESSIPFFGR